MTARCPKTSGNRADRSAAFGRNQSDTWRVADDGWLKRRAQAGMRYSDKAILAPRNAKARAPLGARALGLNLGIDGSIHKRVVAAGRTARRPSSGLTTSLAGTRILHWTTSFLLDLPLRSARQRPTPSRASSPSCRVRTTQSSLYLCRFCGCDKSRMRNSPRFLVRSFGGTGSVRRD